MEPIGQQILQAIKQYHTIIIHRHINPDGDAFGTQLGLKSIIKANFPDKIVYAAGQDADFLSYIGKMDIVPDEAYHGALVIVTDTANQPRIDDQRYNQGAMLIKIDHHPNRDAYGDLQLVDDSAPAACQVLYLWARSCNLTIPADAARALAHGIITDTSRFMYRSISQATFTVMSELMTQGVDLQEIYTKLYYQQPRDLVLKRFYYQNYQKTAHNVIYLKIPFEFLKTNNIDPDQAALMCYLLGNVQHNLLWVVFVEYPDQVIRVEFRANQNCQVNHIAQQFNGGGHRTQAGCKVKTWVETDAILKVMDEYATTLVKTQDKELI